MSLTSAVAVALSLVALCIYVVGRCRTASEQVGQILVDELGPLRINDQAAADLAEARGSHG